jgi:hypothetical protein
VGPRAGLDDVEKKKFLAPPGLELRNLGLPTSNQSLCRLLYPGPSCTLPKYNITNSVKLAKDITNLKIYVGFEVLSAVSMRNSVFWDTTLCSSLKVDRHFGGIIFLRNVDSLPTD